MRRGRFHAVVALLGVALLSGCGADDSGEPPAPLACRSRELLCASRPGEVLCCPDHAPYFCPFEDAGSCHELRSEAVALCGVPVGCGPEPGPICLTCGEFSAAPSVDPSAMCAASRPLYDAILACLCAACQLQCGAACDGTSEACAACTGEAVMGDCNDEVLACQADAAPGR